MPVRKSKDLWQTIGQARAIAVDLIRCVTSIWRLGQTKQRNATFCCTHNNQSQLCVRRQVGMFPLINENSGKTLPSALSSCCLSFSKLCKAVDLASVSGWLSIKDCAHSLAKASFVKAFLISGSDSRFAFSTNPAAEASIVPRSSYSCSCSCSSNSWLVNLILFATLSQWQ